MNPIVTFQSLLRNPGPGMSEEMNHAGREAPGERLVMYRRRPQMVSSILVMKFDHRGDFELARPALSSLRKAFPVAKVFGAVGEWTMNTAIESGLFDEVFSCDFFFAEGGVAETPEAAARAIQIKLVERGQPHVDLAVDMRLDWDTRWILELIPSSLKAGFGPASVFPFLDIALPFYNPTLYNRPQTFDYEIKGNRVKHSRNHKRGFRIKLSAFSRKFISASQRKSAAQKIRQYIWTRLENRGLPILELPVDFETQGFLELRGTEPFEPAQFLEVASSQRARRRVPLILEKIDESRREWRIGCQDTTYGLSKFLNLRVDPGPTTDMKVTIRRKRGGDGPHQRDAYVAIVAVIENQLKETGVQRSIALEP